MHRVVHLTIKYVVLASVSEFAHPTFALDIESGSIDLTLIGLRCALLIYLCHLGITPSVITGCAKVCWGSGFDKGSTPGN